MLRCYGMLDAERCSRVLCRRDGVLNVDSNGASTSGDNTGLGTGKDSVRGLLGGLEPSPELLAIAMGAQD